MERLSAYRKLLLNLVSEVSPIEEEQLDNLIKSQVAKLKEDFEVMKSQDKDWYTIKWEGCLSLSAIEFACYVEKQGFSVKIDLEDEVEIPTTTFFIEKKEKPPMTPVKDVVNEQVGVLKRKFLDLAKVWNYDLSEIGLKWDGIIKLETESIEQFNKWLKAEFYCTSSWLGNEAIILKILPENGKPAREEIKKGRLADKLREISHNAVSPFTLLRENFISRATANADKGIFYVELFVHHADLKTDCLALFTDYAVKEGFLPPIVSIVDSGVKVTVVW